MFEDSLLRIAPIPEQRRIVAALERVFGKVDSCQSHLAKVPTLLKRFRQSVLAAACSGRLTEDWRANNSPSETAQEFLSRAASARVAALGTNADSCASIEGDIAALPSIAEGWEWATVDQLSTRVVDGVHKKPDYVASGIPFLTVRNLTAGRGISFANTSYITENEHREYVKRAKPEKGDVLVTKDGTLGEVRLVETETVFSIFVSLALIKPCIRTFGRYLTLALLAPQIRQRTVVTGTGLQHIHLRDLKKVAIPVPPEEEQQEIVRRTEELLSLADRIEQRAAEGLARVKSLSSSTLARAFRGELSVNSVE